MDHITNRGILYVATGGQSIRKAAESARSCRGRNPEIQRAIFCDDPSLPELDVFDHVLSVDTPADRISMKQHRIDCLAKSPFQQTLHLKPDSKVIRPVGELFELLDRFEFAASHAPWRVSTPIENCPKCFPELDTSVLLYKSSDAVLNLFSRWKQLFSEASGSGKVGGFQPSLRKAVFESSVQMTVLPPEYNLDTMYPSFAGGNATVKILRGQRKDLKAMSGVVNSARRPRIFAANTPDSDKHGTELGSSEE